MSWNDHDHRGQYADDRHDHGLDYAERHHRHHDLETDDKTAQQAITCLRDEVAELRRRLDALDRIGDLEKQTPQAQQLQLEADLAAADLAASGYDRYDEPEPDDYDPGPEVDDEGGMSEYRYTLPEDYQRGQS
jgi:predicted  nucleic acid-binding Zn-ribbon protein